MGNPLTRRLPLVISASLILISSLLLFFSLKHRIIYFAAPVLPVTSSSSQKQQTAVTDRSDSEVVPLNSSNLSSSADSPSEEKLWSNTLSADSPSEEKLWSNTLSADSPSSPVITDGDDRIRQSDNSNTISKLEKLERGLTRSRAAIYAAARSRNYTAPSGMDGVSDFIPMARLYRNPYAFYRSHMEMLKRFKVWCYKEGELPLFHEGPTRSIYGIDGQFIDEMDLSGRGAGAGFRKSKRTNRMIARNPDEAHSFFLPISLLRVRKLVLAPKLPIVHMHRIAQDYVNLLARRYPYWNRSQGADHFVLSCHDWAPQVSRGNPKLMGKLVRALCNANMSEGFHPIRDVSIPEIKILTDLSPPAQGLPLSKRRHLAFFSGGAHGYVRKVLFDYWLNKTDEKEILIYEKLPRVSDYFKMMGESKFCLCPSGYEVASPRIVEAVHSGCVPVLISNNYSPPFGDVLDYTQFSIRIPVERIPEIKSILEGVSTREYMKLVKGVMAVRPHFTLNRPAKPFDMIHMILHSVWLRRLNLRLPV